jgi:hypothetical protein
MLSHSVLLVVGGALLTGLIGALVFGSNGTAEEQRMREERKLLRALDAQRRIRDAQLMRQGRPRQALRVEAQPPTPIGEQPTASGQVVDESEAENRTADRQRKRDEHEQAVALKARRGVEKQDRRREKKEKAATLKAERDAAEEARRATDEQRKRDAHEQAVAAKAQRDADEQERKLAAKPQPPAPSPASPIEPAPAVTDKADKADKPLSELPLYSWAARIEAEDRDAAP